MMRNTPVGALLMIELAYALCSLTAGLVVGKVGANRQIGLALGVGGVFALACGDSRDGAASDLVRNREHADSTVPLAWLGAKLATSAAQDVVTFYREGHPTPHGHQITRADIQQIAG